MRIGSSLPVQAESTDRFAPRNSDPGIRARAPHIHRAAVYAESCAPALRFFQLWYASRYARLNKTPDFQTWGNARLDDDSTLARGANERG